MDIEDYYSVFQLESDQDTPVGTSSQDENKENDETKGLEEIELDFIL